MKSYSENSIFKENSRINIVVSSFYFLLFILLGITTILVNTGAKNTLYQYDEIAIISTQKLQLIGDIRKCAAQNEIELLHYILSTNQENKKRTKAIIDVEFGKNTNRLKQYKQLISDPLEKHLYNDVLSKRQLNYNSKQNLFQHNFNSSYEKSNLAYNATHRANFEDYLLSLDKLSKHVNSQTNEQEQSVHSYVKSVVKKIFVFVVATFIGLILLGLIINRSTKIINQEKQFSKHLLDATPDAIIGINHKHEIILFNKEAYKMFGYEINEINEIIGQPLSALIPNNRQVLHSKYVEQYFKDPLSRKMGDSEQTLCGKRKNGTEFFVDISLSYIQSQNNHYALCSVRDITKIVNTEKQLRQSEELNKSILTSLDSHIAVIDEEGIIVAVNRAWNEFAVKNGDSNLKRTGIGSNYFEVCLEAIKKGDVSAKQALDGILSVLHNGSEKTFELEYPCHSPNQKRWFILKVTKYEGAGQKRVVVNHQNITERKNVEQELISKNNELLKTNTELDRFVYSTSHDLRAPLTSLLGLINLSEEPRSTSEDREKHLEMMKRTVYKLDKLIADILLYSRNSRLEIEHNEIVFKELINETYESLMHMDNVKNFKFQIQVNQSSKFISDKGRILVIFNNLLANAIKYQDKLKQSSYISMNVDANNENAVIVIEDNGIGIEEKNLNRIFDMFFRATQISSGSGIGLYIVKETLDKLQASIKVESTFGKQTKFTIIIPNLAHTLS